MKVMIRLLQELGWRPEFTRVERCNVRARWATGVTGQLITRLGQLGTGALAQLAEFGFLPGDKLRLMDYRQSKISFTNDELHFLVALRLVWGWSQIDSYEQAAS
jgi:hypothetical protein